MPDTTISQLGSLNAITANSVIPVSDGTTTQKYPLANTIYGMRNRIHNGDFRIWQRGTTFNNIAGDGARVYTADRWAFSQNNPPSNFVQRLGGLPFYAFGGFTYCIRAGKPSGSSLVEQYRLWQSIESFNCYDLANKKVTLSFWARKGASYSGGNSFFVALVTGTGVDQDGNLVAGNGWFTQSNVIVAYPDLDTAGKRFVYTGTVGPLIGEMQVYFGWNTSGTASNNNDYLEITGVQLEEGEVATPFEKRDFALEYWMCCRYYNGGGYTRGDL